MANTFDIKIYRSTDSFLYLPAYIAKDLEIFQTVLGSKMKIGDTDYSINIVFEDPKPGEGDEDAILKMIDENTDTSVAIAIGSPVAFLNPNMEEKVSSNVQVVGAIINKLTFWAVDHKQGMYSKTEDLKGKFSKVIYPGEKFITGCYLGRKVQQDAGILDTNIVPVEFDTEIGVLRLHNSNDHSAVAITADIATLAETTIGDNPELFINYRFSMLGDFLTTGIITSKRSCEKFPEIVAKIIEALQKSIAILYSSEKTARRICADIATKQFAQKFNAKNIDEQSDSIKEIIRLMNEEEFYPADLNISKEGWDKAVKALSRTRQWDKDDKKIKGILSDSFYRFVDNKFVLDSEKSIAKQFGISLDTFGRIAIVKFVTTKPFKWIFALFKKNRKWFWGILITLIAFALIFVYQKYSANTITVKEILLNAIISPVSGILLTFLIFRNK